MTSYTETWDCQPDPTPATVDRPWAPRPNQWLAVAAVWLLAVWTGDASPGWQASLATGTAPPRSDEPWPAPPPATELLTRFVPAPEPRAGALVRYLADQLAGPYSDLRHLTVESSADDEVHLLSRDTWGHTLRLSLAPAPQVLQPPVLAADGADGALRTRLACLSTLLSDFLWVNNNNPVDFRIWVGRHGLTAAGDELITAAAAWWARHRRGEYDEEDRPEESDDPVFTRISAAEVAEGLHNTARLSLTELMDGSWSGIEECPQIPDGHLVTHLNHDLLRVLVDRVGGPGGESPLFAYHGFLPVSWTPDEDDLTDEEIVTVLIVGPVDIAVIEIDLTC